MDTWLIQFKTNPNDKIEYTVRETEDPISKVILDSNLPSTIYPTFIRVGKVSQVILSSETFSVKRNSVGLVIIEANSILPNRIIADNFYLALKYFTKKLYESNSIKIKKSGKPTNKNEKPTNKNEKPVYAHGKNITNYLHRNKNKTYGVGVMRKAALAIGWATRKWSEKRDRYIYSLTPRCPKDYLRIQGETLCFKYPESVDVLVDYLDRIKPQEHLMYESKPKKSPQTMMENLDKLVKDIARHSTKAIIESIHITDISNPTKKVDPIKEKEVIMQALVGYVTLEEASKKLGIEKPTLSIFLHHTYSKKPGRTILFQGQLYFHFDTIKKEIKDYLSN